MEIWRRTLTQFRDLLGGMTPSQRFLLVLAPTLVLGALAAMVYLGGGTAEEALLSGKVFAGEELRNAEDALRKGGLSQFRVEGQKILVPRSEAARYNAALITGAGLPQRFGDGFEKAIG